MNLIWGRRDTILAFIQADVHGRGWLDPHEAVCWVGRVELIGVTSYRPTKVVSLLDVGFPAW